MHSSPLPRDAQLWAIAVPPPQTRAALGLGGRARFAARRRVGAYNVLLDRTPISHAIIATEIPNLGIIPSTVDLSGAELELIDVDCREFRLRDALAGAIGHFDYVLIDCPPAFGILTINALTAANAVLVPLQCEFLALEGLSQLVRTIDRVKRAFNPELDIQGIVLTMYDTRNKLSSLVADDVRAYFGDKVYQTVIPRNIRVSEAPSHGKPVLLYDYRCTGSRAYMHLAGEVLRRETEVLA